MLVFYFSIPVILLDYKFLSSLGEGF